MPNEKINRRKSFQLDGEGEEKKIYKKPRLRLYPSIKVRLISTYFYNFF